MFFAEEQMATTLDIQGAFIVKVNILSPLNIVATHTHTCILIYVPVIRCRQAAHDSYLGRALTQIHKIHKINFVQGKRRKYR